MPSKRRKPTRSEEQTEPGRIFKVGHDWYFATREKTEEGPFRSRRAAEKALNDYVMMAHSNLVPPGVAELDER